MDSEAEKPLFVEHQDLEKLRSIRESGLEFRRRRHPAWTENYMLYRGEVTYNRLTHRQSGHVPLMKSAIQSLLKDIDDAPMLYYESKDNDEQRELFFNEYWKYCSSVNKLEIQDIVDKKQVMIFGRSFKKLNIVDGVFSFDVIDPQDILVDRYVNPAILDSARFIVHQNIYKPLKDILENESYDKDERHKLEILKDSERGQLIQAENTQDMMERNERQEALGVENVSNPTLGESYIKLEEFHVKEFDEDKKRNIIMVYVVAQDSAVLLKAPLTSVLGDSGDHYWERFYPFTSWGSDPERTDFWSDGTADVIRPSNKIVDTFYSQLTENRTLRNFNMNYYDATKSPDFHPEVWTPEPWGWFPLPGKPEEVMKNVEVADLSESLDEIDFVLNISKEAVAASSTNQGAIEQKKTTLGEIQLAYSVAKERVRAMSVFYTDSWKEFGDKYVKLLESSNDLIDDVEITRRGKTGKRLWTRTISPKDWLTTNGYQTDVRMVSDKVQEDTEALNRLSAVQQFFPGNKALNSVIKKKALDFAKLSLDEKKEVLDEDKAQSEAPQSPMMPGGDQAGMGMGQGGTDIASIMANAGNTGGMPQLPNGV